VSEIDDKTQTPDERLIEIAFPIAGQNGDAIELFHSLEEVVNLDVGKAVVCVSDLGPLAEEGIGLVKEEDDKRKEERVLVTEGREVSVADP